jgi:hypothetical protein
LNVAEVAVFEYVCAEIERCTPLEGPVVRGTVRLALKEAGLNPESVDAGGMEVVVDKILPQELAAHRIEGIDELCARLAQTLATRQFAQPADRAGAAASVLDRLGA